MTDSVDYKLHNYARIDSFAKAIRVNEDNMPFCVTQARAFARNAKIVEAERPYIQIECDAVEHRDPVECREPSIAKIGDWIIFYDDHSMGVATDEWFTPRYKRTGIR